MDGIARTCQKARARLSTGAACDGERTLGRVRTSRGLPIEPFYNVIKNDLVEIIVPPEWKGDRDYSDRATLGGTGNVDADE